jgi:poly(glycerol-phosphate) alpha-glucosyltransferase
VDRIRVPLPPGRHLALTWSVDEHFGGMTNAMLHRSRAFVRLGGVEVDVLTFDVRPDYPTVERRLRERGGLVDGMRILNLWDWLREHVVAADEPGRMDLDSQPFTPLADGEGIATSSRGDAVLARSRLAADGMTVLQVDHYREDGTLAVSDRRDVHAAGDVGGRSIVLCDHDGVPVRSWGGSWSLYRWWLDRLRAHTRTFVIVDSKTVARFAMTYRRKKATVVHVVHASHLDGGGAPDGALRQSRREVFEHLDAFDSVVLLTERQRQDVAARGIPAAAHLAVIPNSRDLPPAPAMDRPQLRGVVLAGLTSRKRVRHAVTAAQRAAATIPGLTLDVYGDGPERPELEALVAEGSGGSGGIRFHGHDPRAHERLANASFMVATGSSEGFPLVLVEAMAAGCIPIAYDVRYGPSDIITHGRNGLLVPSGDVDALADAIHMLATMTPSRLGRMRRAARRTARRYTDVAITRRWSGELREAEARKRQALASQSAAS